MPTVKQDLVNFWEKDVKGLLDGHPDQAAARALLEDGRKLVAGVAAALPDVPGLVTIGGALAVQLAKDSADVAAEDFPALVPDALQTLAAIETAIAALKNTAAKAIEAAGKV